MYDYCLLFTLYDGDYASNTREYTEGARHWNKWITYLPGDTLTFEWTALSGCEENDTYTLPYHSGSWVHIFKGENYGNQITLPLSTERNPLLGTYSETLIVPDPGP